MSAAHAPLPLSTAGLDALRVVPGDAASLWDRGAIVDQLAVWEERIADLDDAADAGDAAARRERGDLASKTFLLSNLDGIDASMPAAENRRTFEGGVDLVVGILDTATGVFHVESDLVLRIERCVFRVPFQDPRGIAVEGGARLVGFSARRSFQGARRHHRWSSGCRRIRSTLAWRAAASRSRSRRSAATTTGT